MEFGQQIIKMRQMVREQDSKTEKINVVSLGNQDHKDNSKMGHLDSHDIFSFHIFSSDSSCFPETPPLIVFPIPIRLVFLMQLKSHLPNS